MTSGFEFQLGAVKFYPEGMRHLRQDQDGEVGSDLMRRGRELLRLARLTAPFESGALKASLYLRYIKGLKNPSIIVGSRLKYAYYVHEGVAPHEVRPTLPGRMLRFKVNGRIVYATQVNHPGQRPQRYLSRHLRSIVR